MVSYLNIYSPLGVVNICEMTVFRCDLIAFSQNLLVIELRVISAPKVEWPTLNFTLLTLSLFLKQLINNIEHFEMLSLKGFFYWQNLMTKSGHILISFPYIFHNIVNNQVGINDRSKLFINFDKNDALFMICKILWRWFRSRRGDGFRLFWLILILSKESAICFLPWAFFIWLLILNRHKALLCTKY